MDTNLQPFLKWAGGKRQLLPQIKEYVPSNFNTYYEPFLGAGAVLFSLAPKNAVINDTNKELINLYKVIKSKRKLKLLIESLKTHDITEEYYYKVREMDRLEDYEIKSDVEKASRFIFLNKTCYNGLYRVNSKGYFNVPYGKYKNPQFINENIERVLRDANKYLKENNVQILNKDFEKAVKKAKEGDFVYFDPPYDPISKTASFTNYTKKSFGIEEQRRLSKLFIELFEKGCYVLLSNSKTPLIEDLYDYPGVEIKPIEVKRSINSNGSGRGKIKEVLIIGNGFRNKK
jgi:DNA adenine methylase